MKSGTGKGAPDRDRAYWEAPRSALGRIETRIEEIGTAEQEPGLPTTRRERIGGTLWRRRRMVAGGATAAAILVAVLVLASPPAMHATPTQTAQPSSTGIAEGLVDATAPASADGTTITIADGTPQIWTANPYATLDLGPTDSPESDPSYAPIVAKGWPLVIDGGLDAYTDPMSGQVAVGSDGTTYIPGVPVLDSTGHARSAWLKLPGGDDATEMLLASDGTIYATDETDSNATDTMLYGYSTDGKLRSGWPVNVGESPTFARGPSGSVYVFSSVNSMLKVTVLAPTGKTTASWTIGSDQTGTCGDAIRADGTLFYAYSAVDDSTCSILVFSPTGTRLSASPVRAWDGLTMGPDGTVVAYGRDPEPYDSSAIARTRVAVVGTDGLPASGWPVNLEGNASAPAIGADGSIYVAQFGAGTASSRVVSFDKAGNIKIGWPAVVPVGYAPFSGEKASEPLPPVIGADGTVYVAVTNRDWMGSVLALDSSGAVLPGWPYVLPQAFSDFAAGGSEGPSNPGLVYAPSSSGPSRLYLGLEGEIVALAADGSVVPGWPFPEPNSADGLAFWVDFAATPDGGLVTVSEVDGQVNNNDTTKDVVVNLTPDGKVRH